MNRNRLVASSLLCCALLLTACASTNREPRPFDPLAFLKMLTPTGEEGVCRIGTGMLPCKFYREVLGESTFVALYHPQMGYLVAIKEIRVDGTQYDVWNKPPEKQQVVPAQNSGTST